MGNSVTQAMLMAAGLGTRLRPFTNTQPKALFPVLGVPIAQFALDAMARAGVAKVVANVHHHAEATRQGIAQLDRGRADLLVSDESALLLGSAGGIKKARPHFGREPFFLINADVLCDIDLSALAHTHARLRDRWGVTMTLAIFERGPSTGRYREIYLDRDRGLICGFGELATARPFFIGSAVIEPEALALVPEGQPGEFVPLMLDPAIKAGRAGFHSCSGVWKDIGAPSLWLDAHLHLLRGLETGRIDPGWRKRLEVGNHRVAHELWVSNASPRGFRSVDWTGPAYWDGSGIRSARMAPAALGPGAVVYGAVPASGRLAAGIGYQGAWVGV